MSSVFSRSQSSKIRTGAWPPNSNVSRVMLSAHRRIRCLPTLVEPVKLILRMMRLAISVSLTSPLSPCTSWATPAGMPASASARNISVPTPGVSCGGREMTVQPAASAALTFFANK